VLSKRSSRIFSLINWTLISLALLFGAATLIASAFTARPPLPVTHEEFDARLKSIQSVDEAVAYVQGMNPRNDPRSLADAADEFVRRRFVHGYSELLPAQNWLAYLAGFVWYDLKSPVLPEDVLKFRRAACSQQAIVFQAIVRKLGLDVRSVRLVGHFVSAVKIGDDWRVYDANREIEPRSYPLSLLLEGDPRIQQIYDVAYKGLNVRGQAAEREIIPSEINANPAPRGALFQRVTYFFSQFGWALFLGLFLVVNTVRAAISARNVRAWREERKAETPAE
jgi:hypothetical protein